MSSKIKKNLDMGLSKDFLIKGILIFEMHTSTFIDSGKCSHCSTTIPTSTTIPDFRVDVSLKSNASVSTHFTQKSTNLRNHAG